MAAETCLIWSEPGGKIARISAERRGSAATEVDEHGLAVSMVVVHCLLVWKGRTDVSEMV